MKAVVIGHASLDRALVVNRCPGPGMTAVVRRCPTGPHRRAGGVAQTCYALADAGLEVWPVTCAGSDALGEHYRDSLLSGGCHPEGIVVIGDRSPASDLLYADDGGTAVLFDPGTSTRWELTDVQRRLISEADVVVFMIAPAPVTAGALDQVRSDALVAWVVKDDPVSLAGDLPRRLRERADVVVLNHQERHLIDVLPPNPASLLAETRGSEPVRYRRGETGGEVDVPEVLVPSDTTGSGDAFAGGLVAALAAGVGDGEAVAAGVERAGAMLEERQRREG